MSHENTTAITDLYLASALLAFGYKLIRIDHSTMPRARFLFAHTPKIENVINDYWNDSIKLSPQKLFAAQKQIKGRLYADKL
jgi:hypothetical protein